MRLRWNEVSISPFIILVCIHPHIGHYPLLGLAHSVTYTWSSKERGTYESVLIVIVINKHVLAYWGEHPNITRKLPNKYHTRCCEPQVITPWDQPTLVSRCREPTRKAYKSNRITRGGAKASRGGTAYTYITPGVL